MNTEIIIVGAGAAGLMAARELAKACEKVLILEARNRIGGRILPLNESDFGYPAQGGAEFVHGKAPITKALMKEAGLTYVPDDGEVWTVRNGEFSLNKGPFDANGSLKEKLNALTEDIPIFDFLQQNFTAEEDESFKNSIIKMVEGYDAADPKTISTFTLRDEWLTKSEWDDGRIKEGYGGLLTFLESECKKLGVEIRLNMRVKSIGGPTTPVSLQTVDGEVFTAQKVVVTVPLPVLKDIEFTSELKSKIELASRIGFGTAIKVVIRFKDRWWERTSGMDVSKMSFMLCNEKFMTWWTQYPEINPVLVGWMAGPETLQYDDSSSDEILDIALTSLSNVFKIEKDVLIQEVEVSQVINWQKDPFAMGAYSYTTVHTKDAYEQLQESVNDTIFFAGEPFYSGDTAATATVEGALGSGMETAKKILTII